MEKTAHGDAYGNKSIEGCCNLWRARPFMLLSCCHVGSALGAALRVVDKVHLPSRLSLRIFGFARLP